VTILLMAAVVTGHTGQELNRLSCCVRACVLEML